jgi:hypothetical protein
MWWLDNLLYCFVVGGMFWWSGYLAYSPNVRRDQVPALQLVPNRRPVSYSSRDWRSVSGWSLLNGTCVALAFSLAYLLTEVGGVPFELLSVVPFFYFIFIFSRVTHLGKYVPIPYRNACIAAGMTVLWVKCGHWLVLDAVAFMSTVATIVLFRKVQTPLIVVMSFVIILLDTYSVFGPVPVMERLVLHAEATPYLTTTPDSRVAVSLLGFGDFVSAGMLIMVSFRETRVRGTPLYAIVSIVGFFAGLALGVVVGAHSHHAQPGTAYLLGAILISLTCCAWWTRVPVSDLLWGKGHAV